MAIRGESLEDRAERIITALTAGHSTPLKIEAARFIQDLLSMTFRLEQERDALLATEFTIQ